MTSGSGPGKTAPKLAQDFLSFDPRNGRPNILVDSPPPSGEGVQIAAPLGSCKHEYTTKNEQSVPPPIDLRPDGSTRHRLALICKRCRTHADIVVDASRAVNACPSSDHPLHHFQPVPSSRVEEQGRLAYAWCCSIAECSTTVTVVYRAPRLDDDQIDHLSNPQNLKRRYQAAVQEDPGRDGINEATPMIAYNRLATYISNACKPDRSRTSIPDNNKRFIEIFGVRGEECHDLLERLGFKYEYAESSWRVPDPEQGLDRLQANGSTLRELLEDAHAELLACMCRLAADRGVENFSASNHPLPLANEDILRIFAATGYQRQLSTTRRGTINTEIPYYNSLGALPDFADSLIEYSFDRQTECDPLQRPYYFECLQFIAEQRQTEQLQIKVATLTSQDLVSRRDLSAAYRYFGITDRNIPDVQVRDKFQAQQPDLAAAAQEEARQHLYKIGIARNSTLLLSASRQSVDTEEDAYGWLGNGVNRSTSDEGLIAVYAIKKEEGSANEEIALKALSTIAKARKSNTLNNFLLTGEQGTTDMSVDEALRHLNIEQKLEDLEPTVVPIIFETARQDRPGELTERAITAIQQALSSKTGGHAPETWPVGLVSHGNTCYLNSLLQYYFSVKPLRDIVLNYDQYKWDTAKDGLKDIRVGHVVPKKVEIEGGQTFAAELRHLFERMIRSRDSAVKPEADLVCRAFLQPKYFHLMDPNVDEKGTKNGDEVMVNGVDSAAHGTTHDGNTVENVAAALAEGGKDSDASSTTLVNGEQGDIAMSDGDVVPTPPSSPGMVGTDLPKSEQPAPPPLPPRRFSTNTQDALKEAQRKASLQQDVTEVHDSITTLLRYGMSPTGHDDDGESGEQQDVLRNLFSIETTSTPVKAGVIGKAKPQSESAIQLNVPYEDTDIYSALDAVFDLQPVSEDGILEAYRSIKSLSPLLQISIPRIGYDKSRGPDPSFKSEACVRLENELYLDRYFDASHDDTLNKRRQCWGWRKRLRTLKRDLKALKAAEIDLDGPTAVAETAEYLSSLDGVNQDLKSIGVDAIDADGDLTGALRLEAQQQEQRVSALDAEITELQSLVDNQFNGMRNVKYLLAAVFIHRGNAGHGHYWIYIHDFANNIWRTYNDETVDKFDRLEEIFEAKAPHGTPTYAVYVDAEKIHYIDPVCRDVEPEPEPEPQPEPPQPARKDSWSEDWTRSRPLEEVEPRIAIDPPLITEKGNTSWDAGREVAEGVKCPLKLVRFGPFFDGLQRMDSIQQPAQSTETDHDSALKIGERQRDSAYASEDVSPLSGLSTGCSDQEQGDVVNFGDFIISVYEDDGDNDDN